MVIFVKILIFTKMMVKIGGGGRNFCTMGKKQFFQLLNIYVSYNSSPQKKYCCYAIDTQKDMKCKQICLLL